MVRDACCDFQLGSGTEDELILDQPEPKISGYGINVTGKVHVVNASRFRAICK